MSESVEYLLNRLYLHMTQLGHMEKATLARELIIRHFNGAHAKWFSIYSAQFLVTRAIRVIRNALGIPPITHGRRFYVGTDVLLPRRNLRWGKCRQRRKNIPRACAPT